MYIEITLKNKPHIIKIIMQANNKNDVIQKMFEDFNIPMQEIETIEAI